MWHTPLGDRTLVGAEAELVRQALLDMTELLLEEADELAEYWPCGVKLFDELLWQQRLALLTRVAHALLKADSPMAELSAVNEAAVAAIFATIGRNVIVEMDL